MKKKNNSKVLFLCKSRIRYGVSFGLRNSATFVSNELNKLGIKSEVKMVVDGNSIDREVHQYKPDICVIEAIWVTPKKLKEIARLHPKVQFVVRIHSNTEFIAVEGYALEWISEYLESSREYDNIYASANSERFMKDMMSCFGHKNHWVYTPNVYLPSNKHSKNHKPKKRTLDIGCFGAIRPLKNHLQQAVAAIKFADKIGKKLNFYINSDRTEQNGDKVLHNIRALFENSPHKLVELPWQKHEDFMDTVSKMDIVMQVSLSETFCICAADAVSANVPLVTSKEVDWVSSLSKADSTDTEDIVSKLSRAYKSTVLPKYNKKLLYTYSSVSLVHWLLTISYLLRRKGK